MRLEHHLVGGYVRYISPHIIIILLLTDILPTVWKFYQNFENYQMVFFRGSIWPVINENN